MTTNKLFISFILLCFQSVSHSALISKLSASLTFDVLGNTNIQATPFIVDDGSLSNSTYALLNPAGSIQSNATASGFVSIVSASSLRVEANTNLSLVNDIAENYLYGWSTANTEAGYILSNQSDTSDSAWINVGWSYDLRASSGGFPNESVFNQLFLEIYRDSVLIRSLESLTVDGFSEQANIGQQYAYEVPIDGKSSSEVRVALQGISGAAFTTQSIPGVPEPGTLFLVISAYLGILVNKHRMTGSVRSKY